MHDSRDVSTPGGAIHDHGVSLCRFEEFQFRADANSYEARFDSEDVSASIAIIDAMSLVLDRPAEDLPPLGNSVDLEALDTILTTNALGVPGTTSVSFPYHGWDVTVDDAGGLAVDGAMPDAGDAESDTQATGSTD